jgi:hypothetical protein
MTKRERNDWFALMTLLDSYMPKALRYQGDAREAADTLTALGRSLHRSYENACNYQQTPRQLSRESNLEDAVRAIVTRLRWLTGADIRVRFNSDPRGCPIKLVMPRGERNGWDEAWNV